MDTAFNFRIDKLDALTCPKGRRHNGVMDTKVQGLGMRVRPSGAKTLVFYRRLPDNNESARKIIEFTIGKYEMFRLSKLESKRPNSTISLDLEKIHHLQSQHLRHMAKFSKDTLTSMPAYIQ